MKEYKKTYTIEQEQWFNNIENNGEIINEVKNPTIKIRLFDSDDKGIISDFSIVWEKIGKRPAIVLHIHDDSRIAYEIIPDIFEMINAINKQKLNPDIYTFAEMLAIRGFQDITDRKKIS